MKRAAGVTRRPGSTVFQWGIKAPADLRGLYPTQWAHRCSLETANLREANDKASGLQALWIARFAEQRRTQNPQELRAITPELTAVLAERVRAAVLNADDLIRDSQAGAFLAAAFGRMLEEEMGPVRFLTDAPSPPPDLLPDPARSSLEGLTTAQAAGLARTNALMEGAAVEALARRRLVGVLGIVKREAGKLGLSFDADAPGGKETLLKCLQAYRTARREVTLRDAGEIIETPKAPTTLRDAEKVRQVTAEMVYLRDVLARWKGDKTRKPQTEQAAEKALSLYEEGTGNPPMASLTRLQGSEFKAWLLARGTTAKTARDRFDYVKGFLNFASRDLELIPRNPWEGLAIEYTTTVPRRPWSTEQLQKLMALPLFASYAIPAGWQSGQDAAYWIPLLGVFSGARVSELAQLRVVDVQTVDGVPILRITNEAEHASIKTEAGRRVVPVHAELISLGFLDYVDAIRKTGATSMWPALRLAKGKAGSYFSQWFSEVRKTDAQDVLPDFHSLRHTVRSRLASAEVAEPLIDALIGHEIKGSTGARTYTQRTTADLKRAMDRLAYPGVPLRRAFTAPAWKPTN